VALLTGAATYWLEDPNKAVEADLAKKRKPADVTFRRPHETGIDMVGGSTPVESLCL
jgi:hypothetical protein